VYSGQWSGHKVAIKQLNSQSRKHSLKDQVAFTREVAIMSKVDHFNLVQFYGVSFNAHHPCCIITAFCEGGTLYDLLHNSVVDLVWAQQLKMCFDIANAMNYLHKFTPQIIHRDLKSMNCLLIEQVGSVEHPPNVQVADFGLSRMKPADTNWEQMTKGAGTNLWMAPEVPSGKYNETADIYSYAMILFEITCREIPFEDEVPDMVPHLIMEGKRPDLEAIPPDCPAQLQDLMESCWDHDPDKRPRFDAVLESLVTIKALRPEEAKILVSL